MSDTRPNIYLLLDYKEYYNSHKTHNDAIELIRDIPSLTLINYISGFSVNLYLSEGTSRASDTQKLLADSLVRKTGKEGTEQWNSVVFKQHKEGHQPIMFWSYSNLFFYGLVFSRFNQLPSRDLSRVEAQNFFDAYLIINSIINEKITIEDGDINQAVARNQFEDILIPNFIYQKDYASTTDFSNQVTRGSYFFQYLESHPKYGSIVREYYVSKKVAGYKRMFKNLMILFSELKVGKAAGDRSQIARLVEYCVGGEIDLGYIETLCINNEISDYKQDQSFSLLRGKCLFKINQYEYFVLDVNFLIDQFYKAQVFAFNAFLKSKKITGEFLSIKAKEFTENIYLPEILSACFPSYIRYFGESCKNSKGEELCDVYLRERNKICLMEFKDVLLNANAKNMADKQVLYGEFDKKFLANQKSKPKGITQLLNGIKDVESHSIHFDKSLPKVRLEVYPVIVYTDFSFGVEGLNKIYRDKFREDLTKLAVHNIEVHEVTFINLSFFEIRQNYLQQNLLSFFAVLDAYHKHTNSLTSFEVFSKFYMEEHITEDLGLPALFQTIKEEIFTA